MRELSPLERSAMTALSSRFVSSDERQQFERDLDNCVVKDVVGDGSRLALHIAGYERPPYRGQHAFKGKDGYPVEGVVNDTDGVAMDVWLFADSNGRALEIEISKQSGDPVLRADWATFRPR